MTPQFFLGKDADAIMEKAIKKYNRYKKGEAVIDLIKAAEKEGHVLTIEDGCRLLVRAIKGKPLYNVNVLREKGKVIMAYRYRIVKITPEGEEELKKRNVDYSTFIKNLGYVISERSREITIIPLQVRSVRQKSEYPEKFGNVWNTGPAVFINKNFVTIMKEEDCH